jgi:hypothetical protein
MGVMIKTEDAGENWQLLHGPTGNNLFDIYFTDYQTGWVVGDGGTILKTNSGGIVSDNHRVFENQTLTIIPNPAGNYIRIPLTKRYETPVNVLVTDAMGKMMIRREIMPDNRIELDVSHLSPGLYLIQWTISGKSHNARFLISRP